MCPSAIENDSCLGKINYFSDTTKQWMIKLRVGDLDKMAVIRRSCITGTQCLKLKWCIQGWVLKKAELFWRLGIELSGGGVSRDGPYPTKWRNR
jgi:hypothetical protein